MTCIIGESDDEHYSVLIKKMIIRTPPVADVLVQLQH